MIFCWECQTTGKKFQLQLLIKINFVYCFVLFCSNISDSLTAAFIEAENEHKFRQSADRKHIPSQSSMPLNGNENVTENQVHVNNSIGSNAENVKMENVFPSTTSNAVNSGKLPMKL